MTLLALKSLEYALNNNVNQADKIESKNYLRWLSFSEYLYVKSVCRLMNDKNFDFETKDFLLFKCL